MQKPEFLYHGSTKSIDGPLTPILEHSTVDHSHTRPAVFATERKDVAAMFMFPLDTLASIGFEQDISYICIWGTREEFVSKDNGGFLYILPNDTFEKIGKDYEWQSFSPVTPIKIDRYSSVIEGMLENNVQVYFIDDDPTFDKIVEDKNNRALVLKNLVSENERRGINIKKFV